jgi:hypothetical protein
MRARPRFWHTLSLVSRLAPVVLGVLAVLGMGAATRGPLHVATFGLPVSNDDAILLLMARHLLKGEVATVLWNQPYNGALDAYLLAPLVAALPHHAAYRLYQLACAVLLVLLAGLLARAVGTKAAGWIAALLAACGAPYMALMTATGPPPNFLMPLLTGFPLLVGLRALGGEWPRGLTLLATGFVAGLAVWNSSLAIPAFAGMAAGLLVAGLRPSLARLVPLLGGVLVGLAPLLIARIVGASGARIGTAASAVTALRPSWLWGAGLEGLGRALMGLAGFEVPLVVDGPERVALAPPLPLLLAAALAVALLAGSLSRRALPLIGWAAALAGAFALSRRTGPDDLRYLFGLTAPALALVGAGIVRLGRWRRWASGAAALAIVIPWLAGEWRLAVQWRDPAVASRVWQVPPIVAALETLGTSGVSSAYASLQFAGRLTLDSGHAIIASQAWNERIPGDSLRFRDEVDLDPNPAWVLSPRLSRGMPRAGGFRDLVRSMGGSFAETPAGELVVFHGFRPPYDESRPVASAEMSVETTSGAALGPEALDRNPRTAWTAREGLARGSGIVVRLRAPRRLSALVLLVDLARSPLAVPWAASLDGRVVAQGPLRAGFQWVNGAPRAGKQALLAVPLDGSEASRIDLVFQGPGPPLAVAEVFGYGPDEAERPPAAAGPAAAAFEAARAGRWSEAVRLYEQAWRAEPDRASHHAAWARARWRAAARRWLDVESLDDGGPELVGVR